MVWSGLVWSVSCFIPQLAYCIIHNFPKQLRTLAKYVQLMQKITYHNQLHNKLYNVIPHLWSINIPRVQKQQQFWHEYIYIRLNYEGLGRTCFKIWKKQPTHIASPTQTVCFEHQQAYLSRVNRKIKQSSEATPWHCSRTRNCQFMYCNRYEKTKQLSDCTAKY